LFVSHHHPVVSAGRRVALGVAAAAATTVIALPAAPASAATPATVRVNPGTSNGPTLVFDGGQGNTNNLRIFSEAGEITVTDGVALTAGEGCRIVATGKARCGTRINSVFVLLRDGNDTASVEVAKSGQVLGEDGNDFLRAGQTGFAGVTYNGGPGFDTVSYARSPDSVAVTLDDQNNDGDTIGTTGKGFDNVRDDVERVSGSELADRMTGDERTNEFLGLGGNDSIDPGAGVDRVFAATGDDVITVRDGFVDTVDGGPGFDRATIDRTFDTLTTVESVS
jgi:hypothetical protein